MNCRTFRKHHVSFVDDTASGLARAQMEEHLRQCRRCATQDARVRRALLIARNLPGIEPSAEFRERLHQRLIASTLIPERNIAQRMRYGAIAAAAAVLLSVGTFAGMFAGAERSIVLSMPPVVASVPASFPSPAEPPVLTSAAVVATFSTGLALWPAALVADEAADYFVNAAFFQDNLTR
jgi:hypothetical protein